MKTSIIILTYNQLSLTEQCIESIKRHTTNDIELIIVDNGSTDGTQTYLNELPGAKLIFNKKNEGFARGCNQGLAVSSGENVLFLNNDTIVTKGWLNSMLALLYKNKKIGMVGPVSNYVSGSQQIPVTYSDINDIDTFSEHYCRMQRNQSRQSLRLVGFALLVKKEVLDKVGGFDERFKYGSFEDDDLCLRVIQEGYELHVALDSFVHHHGHATFNGNKEIDIHHLFRENKERFIEKWRVDLTYFMHPRPEIISLVPTDSEKILDIGCGAGATGMELLNRQHCELYGVEINQVVGNLAKVHYKRVDIMDIEGFNLPYENEMFDAIILGDVLEHLKDPWDTVKQLSILLKPEGSIVCSIPNIAHGEALLPLLTGQWNYVSAGILDSTHLRFFTPQTVMTLFPENLFTIHSNTYMRIPIEPREQLFLNEVSFLAEKFGYSMNQLADYATIYQMLIHVHKKA